MSRFSDALGRVDTSCMEVFGEDLTYEQDLAGQFTVTGIVQRGDLSSEGLDAGAIVVDVDPTDFEDEPYKSPREGDRIITDAKLYRVARVHQNETLWRLVCRYIQVVQS